jgi:hypothetical protein
MATEPLKPTPFIAAGHRHDLLSQLARTRVTAFDQAVQDTVARGIKDPEEVKLDGKNGGLDGLSAGFTGGGITEDQPYSPWQPPKVPKGKETKDDKDGGKDQKDGKEDKDGKESKDSKEQGKDSSDGSKVAGDENSDPFSRFGQVEHLNWALMNQVARQNATQVRSFVRSVQVF